MFGFATPKGAPRKPGRNFKHFLAVFSHSLNEYFVVLGNRKGDET